MIDDAKEIERRNVLKAAAWAVPVVAVATAAPLAAASGETITSASGGAWRVYGLLAWDLSNTRKISKLELPVSNSFGSGDVFVSSFSIVMSNGTVANAQVENGWSATVSGSQIVFSGLRTRPGNGSRNGAIQTIQVSVQLPDGSIEVLHWAGVTESSPDLEQSSWRGYFAAA